MSLLDDFFTRALVAAFGVALVAAPLGCFLIWRRMAFFGDATAHGALFGVALAIALNFPIWLGALGVALGMALIVLALSARQHSSDTVLSVLTHSALALALLMLAVLPRARLNLEGLLFGDILAVTHADLGVIWCGGLLIAGLLGLHWQGLLTVTLNPDLAKASGLAPRRYDLVLMIALSLVIAIGIEIIGALLISALLIIPAASARSFAKTPEAMAGFAAGFGVLASMAGLGLSLALDTPAGPSIVAVSAALFALAQLARLRLS
ncbi:MAG: metal ABC transporter permease [Pseudomonadota bacterium]